MGEEPSPPAPICVNLRAGRNGLSPAPNEKGSHNRRPAQARLRASSMGLVGLDWGSHFPLPGLWERGWGRGLPPYASTQGPGVMACWPRQGFTPPFSQILGEGLGKAHLPMQQQKRGGDKGVLANIFLSCCSASVSCIGRLRRELRRCRSRGVGFCSNWSMTAVGRIRSQTRA